MTHQEAVDLIHKLLKAGSEHELMAVVALHLPAIDGTFFAASEAAARRLEQEGKPAAATALRRLSDRMLRLKTLV